MQGLLANQVEMCAITDHDAFNYGMYYELKKEEQKNNCVKKVLPGIEFSVEFVEGKVIHIVTIFDDRDDEKVRNIQKIMGVTHTERIGCARFQVFCQSLMACV